MRAVREKGKIDVFFFSGKDWKDVCCVLWVEAEIGSQLSRPWGIGTAAKTVRARVAAQGGTQRVEGCGRRSSLSSLYTLDTYVGA